MALSSQQVSKLLSRISSDPHVNTTLDKSILIEEQYPVTHHVVVEGSGLETSMSTITTLLDMDMEIQSKLPKEIMANLLKDRKAIQEAYELNPTVDLKWSPIDYIHWMNKVTTVVVSAVRESLMKGTKKDENDATKILFAGSLPDMSVKPGEVKNIPGLTLCDSILLDSPWDSPGVTRLNTMIDDFIKRKKPYLHRGRFPDRYEAVAGVTEREQQQAKAKYETLKQTVEETLQRLYVVNSHTFHVFLRSLIPGARNDKSHLFTRIVEHRHRHFEHNRVLHLADQEIIPYTALTTLDFVEKHFVQEQDDQPVITWTNILMNTRFPGMPLYKWISSFDILLRKYLQSIGKPKPTSERKLRLRQCIGAQLSDFELQKLSESNSKWDGTIIADGKFKPQVLKTAVASIENKICDRKYLPPKRVKIMIVKRAKDHSSESHTVTPPAFALKGISDDTDKRTPAPKRKQEVAFHEQETYNFEDGHYEQDALAFEDRKPFIPCTTKVCVQNGWHKRHSIGRCWQVNGKPTSQYSLSYQDKGGRGHGNSFYSKGGKGRGTQRSSSSKGKGKGKSKGKSAKGKHSGKGKFPVMVCEFCQEEGHLKERCGRHEALQTAQTYYNFLEGKSRSEMYCIDLLENAVDTQTCPCCYDPWCNAQGCVHPVETLLFNKTSSAFVKNGVWDLVSAAKKAAGGTSHPLLTKESLLFNETGGSSSQVDESWGQGSTPPADSEKVDTKENPSPENVDPPSEDERDDFEE